jgi:hypothetical protein
MSLAVAEEFRWSLLVAAFILNRSMLNAVPSLFFFSESMSCFAPSAQYLVSCAAMLFWHDYRDSVGAGLFAAAAMSTIEAEAQLPSVKAGRF